MMFFLTRDSFAGRWMDAEGLQALTGLWMDLYERAARTGGRTKPGYCTLEAELWGFPRVHAEWYRQGIEQRAQEWGLYDVKAELKDPDTLRITGPAGVQPPLSSLTRWLHLCLSPELQGLWCELYLTARDRPGPTSERGYGGSLAVAGTLQGDGMQVVALWPTRQGKRADALYQWVRWEHERALFALLDAAQNPGSGPWPTPPWTGMLFGEPGSNRIGELTLAFMGPNERGLGAFLGRAALSAAAVGITGYLAYAVSQNGIRIGSLLFAGACAVSLIGFSFTLSSKWKRITSYRRMMRNSFQRLYSQSIRFPEVDLQALQVASDPTLRKLSADLEALACHHHADVTIEPPLSGRFYNRIYLLPDGKSFLCLALMRATQSLEVYPAKPSLLITTYLADGTRVVSSNHRGGYRKPLPLPLISRSYPDARDPESLIKCHHALVAKVSRHDNPSVPLDAATILERMVEEHELTRPLMEKNGYYTWEDAFRESFDLVRPEYRD